MVHLNLPVDLETALRKIATESKYPLTTICTALMHLGLQTGAKRIDAACALHMRPMGRPVTEVPVLEGRAKAAADEPLTEREKAEMANWFAAHPGAKSMSVAEWRKDHPPKAAPKAYEPRYKTVKGVKIKLEPWE